MRPPAVAGQFYAGTESALTKQIKECYLHPFGPGKAPSLKKGERKLLGLVSPHAGYMYSGPIAAHGFEFLANDGAPQSVVIFGPNHTGMGSGVSSMSKGRWRTPLGEVEIDEKLAKEILKNSQLLDEDEDAHVHEHSIEVQLPFLQQILGSNFKFVPICMMLQDEETSTEVGKAVGEACREKNTVVIASTDFTHYEPQETAVKKDRAAIEKILALDPHGLFEVVEEKRVSMCGYGPVAAMLVACKKLGARKGELLKYATSGDVAGPMPGVVGYASIAITR